MRERFQVDRIKMPSGRFVRTESRGELADGKLEARVSMNRFAWGEASWLMSASPFIREKKRGETQVRPFPSGPSSASAATNSGFLSSPSVRPRQLPLPPPPCSAHPR